MMPSGGHDFFDVRDCLPIGLDPDGKMISYVEGGFSEGYINAPLRLFI